jgi:2-oxoglutarate ferredoxin oxidoreductase subunit gamma
LNEECILITDSLFVEQLGAIVKLTAVVSVESLTKAVLSKVPRGTEELNEKAIKLGMELVK